MHILIENEAEKSLDFDYKKVINDVVIEALRYEKCPYEAEVSVTLTNNKEIHESNLSFRGIDRPTDVLSFPMVDYDEPADFSIAESSKDDYFNPETGDLLLGDIVISVDKVYEQAEEYGHSPKREFAFLVAHSMLHLFGYDHMEEDERKVMEDKQRKILNNLGIMREIT